MNIVIVPADHSIVALDKTPLLGGQGREGIAHLGEVNANVAGVLLEGHVKPLDGSIPADESPDWYPVLTAPADGLGTVAEVYDLPDYIRLGETSDEAINLEGVQ